MRCLHINIRKATFILLSVLLNGVQQSHMGMYNPTFRAKIHILMKFSAGNQMDLNFKDKTQKNTSAAEEQNYPIGPLLVSTNCAV